MNEKIVKKLSFVIVIIIFLILLSGMFLDIDISKKPFCPTTIIILV